MALGSDLNFVSAYKLCPLESELCQLVEQIDHCNSDAVYKKLIDEIIKRYVDQQHGTPESNYIRNIVINCFTKSSARKNIRKYMYETFNRTSLEENVLLFEGIMRSLTNEIQENLNNLNSLNVGQCFNILCFLGCYIQCLNTQADYVYVLVKALPFYSCILEVYTSQLSNANFCRDDIRGKGILEYTDCYTVLDMSLGQLSSTLPRAQFIAEIRCYAVRMVVLCHDVLVYYSQLKFETISKAAVVESYFALHLPQEEKEFLKHKNFPIMDFLDHPENNYCMVLKIKRLVNLYDSALMKLILSLSIYTSITTPQLMSLQFQGKPMLITLFTNLCDFGMGMSSYPERMQPISGTLMALAKHIHELDNYTELYKKALSFCFANLEYSLDIVVRNTKRMLSLLLREAGKRQMNGNDDHLDIFFHALNSRHIYSKVYLNALLSASSVLHCDIILMKCKTVQNHLLTLITTTAEYEIGSQIYTNMMRVYLKLGSEEKVLDIWLRPVLAMLRRPNIKHNSILEDIVTLAFQTRPEIFRQLFNPKTVGTVRESAIILKCIHYARVNGVEIPLEQDANPEDFWRNLLAKARLELFMVHQEDEIRLNTLQVIAECQRSTEEFTEFELQYLIRYFELNVAPQAIASRNKICAYFKKILTRFHNTRSALFKKITSLRDKLVAVPQPKKAEFREIIETVEVNSIVIKYYEEFFNHFMRLLAFYLSPDANHSRRSTSLELLIFVRDMSTREEWLRLFQRDEVTCLKHIIHDNYEGNKSMAVTLLRTLPPETIGFDNEDNTRKYYDLGIHMACDTRPSQSLSACYMFRLVLLSEFDFKSHDRSLLQVASSKHSLMVLAIAQKMEVMYKECSPNLIEASRATPFYGLLLSCRKLLSNRDIRDDNAAYAFIFHQLTSLCLRIKNHIMPVVCNTSPEGHIPETSDESDESFLESELACRSQKILVYSWKTMKEIMLLLAELANQAVTLENVMEMLNEDYLINIGEFFVDVFIRTKHRGVFEQAHAAFTTICRSFLHSKSATLNKLPKRWLNYGVGLCTGVIVDTRLCPTRRSAGLPFLILSILPTLAELHREYIRRAIDPLLLKARGGGDEHRIHCLNVLRFIFKNSKLTENLKRFVDRGTIAALDGFRSTTWGVRNSATLLLSTLITKIFGVPNKSSSDADQEETRLTTGAFALNHKQLFEFLLNTLEEECENSHSLILHPVLLILSRLYPSYNQNINEQVQRYIRCIDVCMRNPAYRTRDLAARASVSLIAEHLLSMQLAMNFTKMSVKFIRDTECHGLLLQVAHILNNTSIEDPPITEYLRQTKHILSEVNLHYSHMTVCLYMDVLFMMLSRYRDYCDMPALKEIIVLLDRQKFGGQSTCETSFHYSRFQLLVCILVTKFQHVAETYPFVSDMIITCLYTTDYEMKRRVLQFLIYLNQEFSDDQFREHPVFIGGDIEIAPQIKALVHSLDFKSKKELLTFTHPFLIQYFYAENKAQIKLQRDYYVLAFLLMRFYPCFFIGLDHLTKQETLNWFLYSARKTNEELTSAVISTIKVFLMVTDPEELKTLNYRDLIHLLMDSAKPSAADFRRLSVAQFLVGIQVLFKNRVFNEYDRYNLLNIIMILLEDDEALIRNTMSAFPTKGNSALSKIYWEVIPNKARCSLALTTTYDFKNEVAICCLASWALRRLPEITRDTSATGERSDLNTFAENIPVTHAMTRALHSVLWNLGTMLSYKARSIFLEEQTLLVTTIVLNSLLKVPSPMVAIKTKRTVICALKSICHFMEGCKIGEDFRVRFKTFFNEKIVKFLRNSLDSDYTTAKAFFTYLYNPLLEVHSQFP